MAAPTLEKRSRSNSLFEVEEATAWPGFKMLLCEMAVRTVEKCSNKLCEMEEAITLQLSEMVTRTLEKCSNKLCEVGDTIVWPGFEMQLSEVVMRTNDGDE